MIPVATATLLIIIGATVLAACVGGARKRDAHPWYTPGDMQRQCAHRLICRVPCQLDCRIFRLQTRRESDTIQRMG